MGFTYQLFFHLCVFIELQVGWNLENIQLSSVFSLLEMTFFLQVTKHSEVIVILALAPNQQ